MFNLSENFLNNYESDQEIEEVENFPPKIPKSQIKIKRKTKVYNLEKLFENKRDITLERIKSSGYSKKMLHPTDNGLKQYFYCNIDWVNFKLDAFLFNNNSNNQVEFHVEDGIHYHQIVHKSIKNSQIEEKVKALMKDGIKKPNLIMRQ